LRHPRLWDIRGGKLLASLMQRANASVDVHAQLEFPAGGFNVEIHIALYQTDDLSDLARGLAAHSQGQAFHLAFGQ
jgi:hypothetical protein